MLDKIFGATHTRKTYHMPTASEFGHELARGAVRGVFRMIGGVLFLAFIIAAVGFGGKYQAQERIKAEQEAEARYRQSTNSNYSRPPSPADGWGESAFDTSR